MSDTSVHDASTMRPWLAVFFWYGIILLTIPFARDLQKGVEYLAGARGVYLAVIPFALLIIVVLTKAFRRDQRRAVKRLCWLLALIVVSAWVLMTKLQQTIEYIHFIQYSILSALLVIGWRHRHSDASLYMLVLLSLAIAAVVDEMIQWAVPGRYWDLRDVRLNILAGGIMLLFMTEVVRAERPGRFIARRSVRTACRLAWALVLLMAFVFWNTPARVANYASWIPGLHFLEHNQSVMAEYGYKHTDDQIGSFYSRLTMEALAAVDQSRGREAGEIIAAAAGNIEYMDFLRIHTSHRDPFLHELRVHLYRRNHYYQTAWKYKDKDPGRYAHHMTVALRENQLLERYFPTALAAAQQVLSENAKVEIMSGADTAKAYTSPVSGHLIHRWRMAHLQAVFLVLAVGIGMIYVRYGKERHE